MPRSCCPVAVVSADLIGTIGGTIRCIKFGLAPARPYTGNRARRPERGRPGAGGVGRRRGRDRGPSSRLSATTLRRTLHCRRRQCVHDRVGVPRRSHPRWAQRRNRALPADPDDRPAVHRGTGTRDGRHADPARARQAGHRPAGRLVVDPVDAAFASISIAYLAGGGGATLRLAGPGRIEPAPTAAITLVTVAALGARKPHRVDGWIVVGAFAVQAVFTSWPAHLFLTLALLIYATDVLAPPLCTQVRRLRTAAGTADRDTRA